jgi:uncharacterized membrane protein YeaQ/YmgE (transglycosylase-associated protein family)
MDILIVIVAMVVVGAVIGALAGRIWKDDRPYGLGGDMAIGAVSCAIVGLLDWFVIPAMGFSQQVVLIGLVFEPALSALLVLWLLRRARR